VATGYEVVHETIATGAYEDPLQQVDAPTGTYVVGVMSGDPPTFNMPSLAELILDGSDRVTGMLVHHWPTVAQDVWLICVDA
jgi:hypothetical protein